MQMTLRSALMRMALMAMAIGLMLHAIMIDPVGLPRAISVIVAALAYEAMYRIAVHAMRNLSIAGTTASGLPAQG